MKDKELTVSEVALLLGVSRQYVHYLVREGRLVARKTNFVWMIAAAELEKYNQGRAKK